MKKLGKLKNKLKKPEPLWKGPYVDGVTQSMLQKFMVCRERFRVAYVEGLQLPDTFRHAIRYGDLWHVCEEYHSAGLTMKQVRRKLADFAQKLIEQYPYQTAEVDKWYHICGLQFPVYVEHWEQHPTQFNYEAIGNEDVFNVPLTLPSGKTVKLRGKFDGVGIVDGALTLWENKTKGIVDEEQLKQQLKCDFQTMTYLTALWHESLNGRYGDSPGMPRHILYNVVRRPLSGGKGSIKQHKPTKKNPNGESLAEFYSRLKHDVIAADPDHFFKRWVVDISEEDIQYFKTRVLIPLLDQLCNWWDWLLQDFDNVWDRPYDEYYGMVHWQSPFGVYNPLSDAKKTDVDEYILSGNKVGLSRADKLFKELDE